MKRASTHALDARQLEQSGQVLAAYRRHIQHALGLLRSSRNFPIDHLQQDAILYALDDMIAVASTATTTRILTPEITAEQLLEARAAAKASMARERNLIDSWRKKGLLTPQEYDQKTAAASRLQTTLDVLDKVRTDSAAEILLEGQQTQQSLFAQ